MKVGDIVYPINGKVLACGSGEYGCAVVVSVKPFILTSGSADMLWSNTVDPKDFEVRACVLPDVLEICMARLYRDFPNHKFDVFMAAGDET